MFQPRLTLTLLLTLGSLGLLTGCGGDEPAADGAKKTADGEKKTADGDKKEADHHDVPLTPAEIDKLKADTARYEDAMAKIQEYQTVIKKETTDGEPEKAHRALDNLDVVLERLPEAAQNSGVPKEKWEAVNTAAQALRDAFNKVHANIDAKKEPDYKAVAETVDTNLKTLTEIKPAPTN